MLFFPSPAKGNAGKNHQEAAGGGNGNLQESGAGDRQHSNGKSVGVDTERIWRFIFQLGGAVGVNPNDLTLRELLCMIDGRLPARYSVAAYHASVIVNLFSTDKATPNELNPYHSIFEQDESKQKEECASGVEALRTHADELGIKVVNKRMGE